MNLRVLIFSNPLVVDKISKKFLYWKDSGFIYTKNLISSLPESWRFYWLVPESLSNEEWFKEANKNVVLIPYPYSTSIHQNRYEFYGKVLKENFPYSKDIDVVINNQPEVTGNLNVYFENQRRENPIILNFYHWIDCEESRKFAESLGGYFWRQYEGAINADVNYFHNEYAYQLFENMMKQYLKNPLHINRDFFHPPATKFGSSPFSLPDQKIVLFNHRLNNTTNWKFFLECAEKLRKIRKDFVVWFTDDSDKAKSKLLSKDWIINKSVDFSEYGYLLKNSHFSVCTHKGYSTWNMAILDSLNAETFVLVPETEDLYKYMFWDYDETMYHDNTEELVSIMSYNLDKNKNELKSKAKKIKEYFDIYFEDTNENVYKTISNIIEKHVQNYKKLAGYDKVLNYIIEGDKVTKKDFVNRFWSFHTNSNFQKIRWTLLAKDGIIDDTEKDYPTYRKEI